MFLYKTFWNLYKTKYFLYKNRRKFRDVFYLVGYDSLISFPSVCLFLRILSIKNLFFQNEPSFLICIYSLFVWIFSYFFGCYGRFFCPASHPFLHFFRPLAKNNLLFFHPDHPFSEIFSLRRNNFSCLFYVELRKFSVSFDIFYASPEFFQKKNPLFSLSITQFQTFFPCHRDNFHVFSRAGKEIFLPVFIIFVLFPGLFKRKIRFFQHEFPLRTNIFSLPRGVFPDFFRVIR